MKKGQVYEGLIEKVEFPNKGIVSVEGEENKGTGLQYLSGMWRLYVPNHVL